MNTLRDKLWHDLASHKAHTLQVGLDMFKDEIQGQRHSECLCP